MYLLKHNWSTLARNAWANRQELIAAGLTSRRDLIKLGLLTSTGMLIAKHGLSSRVADAADIKSPNTRAFIDPLPIPIPLRPLAMGVNSLSPLPSIYPNNAAGEVTLNMGITGPHLTLGAACAAGNAGFIHAAQMLRLDEVDLAIAGGVSESIHTFGIFASFAAQGALATHDDPTKACRPFDVNRNGILPSHQRQQT